MKISVPHCCKLAVEEKKHLYAGTFYLYKLLVTDFIIPSIKRNISILKIGLAIHKYIINNNKLTIYTIGIII